MEGTWFNVAAIFVSVGIIEGLKMIKGKERADAKSEAHGKSIDVLFTKVHENPCESLIRLEGKVDAIKDQNGRIEGDIQKLLNGGK